MEFKKNVSFVPHSPPLEEVVEILHKGLKDYFETVDVSLVDSPKFNEKPYCLSLSGLHGKPTIADVGGGKSTKLQLTWYDDHVYIN